MAKSPIHTSIYKQNEIEAAKLSYEYDSEDEDDRLGEMTNSGVPLYQKLVVLGVSIIFTSFVFLFMNKSGRSINDGTDLRQTNDGCSIPAKLLAYDKGYPGTAIDRVNNIRNRVLGLLPSDLNGDWSDVRRKILWAGGMKDITEAQPGEGYTGHSFNDFNHCDLTAMNFKVADNTNMGQVDGIDYNNPLGKGIKIASDTSLGDGGSWSTCMIGCNKDPPQDVAHLQFHARIAFKLVWVPTLFNSFVLVDDDGCLLNKGTPTGILPDLQQRKDNYGLVVGSKYANAADNFNV